jgi:hypothetical protein
MSMQKKTDDPPHDYSGLIQGTLPAGLKVAFDDLFRGPLYNHQSLVTMGMIKERNKKAGRYPDAKMAKDADGKRDKDFAMAAFQGAFEGIPQSLATVSFSHEKLPLEIREELPPQEPSSESDSDSSSGSSDSSTDEEDAPQEQSRREPKRSKPRKHKPSKHSSSDKEQRRKDKKKDRKKDKRKHINRAQAKELREERRKREKNDRHSS